MDDYNADTILTFSMLAEPLLIAFVDLTLWDDQLDAAGHQKKYIDDVHKLLHWKLHNKAVPVLVPIDDSKLGNLAIRDAFGLTDKEKYYLYPQIVMLHPNDGRFAVLEHPPEPAPENRKKDKFGKNVVASRFTINRIVQWVNSLEIIKNEHYQQLDLDQMETLNDEVYAFIPKTSRDEVYKLEQEFN